MLRLLHADGTVEEMEEAATARLEGQDLVCRDAEGFEVARFGKYEVTVFREQDSVARLKELKDALLEQWE